MNISKTKDNLKNNGQLNLIEYVYTKKSCLIIQGKTNEFSSIYLYCILVDELVPLDYKWLNIFLCDI